MGTSKKEALTKTFNTIDSEVTSMYDDLCDEIPTNTDDRVDLRVAYEEIKDALSTFRALIGKL